MPNGSQEESIFNDLPDEEEVVKPVKTPEDEAAEKVKTEEQIRQLSKANKAEDKRLEKLKADLAKKRRDAKKLEAGD